MRKILALLRSQWMGAASYRANLLLQFGGLVASVVPVYFVTRALQSTMAGRIEHEGGQYFAFVVAGMVAMLLVQTAAASVSSVVSAGISSGVLESYLATPTHLATILVGLSSYGILWSLLRGALLLFAGWVLGARVEWSAAPNALLLLLLLLLAYLPFGLLTAAMVITWRFTLPVQRAVLLASTLLGGVYFPTDSVPSWLRYISAALPMTYGLRALRAVLIEGRPLGAVAGDVATLIAFVVVLMGLGLLAFSLAFRAARRAGTLTHL